MRKLGIAVTVMGLTALGLAVPATAAQATGTGALGAVCDSKWPGRDGYVRAWDGKDCSGTYLGGTESWDSDWGNSSGPFQGSDANRASSVMNSGFTGGRDVVAFYRLTGFDAPGGYNCLKAQELYVDDLSRNTYTNGQNMNNSISSHQWVNANACSRFMS